MDQGAEAVAQARRAEAWKTGAKVLFDRESIRLLVAKEPTVYRLWGWPPADGGVPELFYIGASLDPKARLLSHLRAGWATGLAVASLHTFRNPTAMARSERVAITEMPTHPTTVRRHGSWRAQCYLEA